MTTRLLERQIALAGVALLTTLGALALFERSRDEAPPAAAPPAANTWYEAAAGVFGPGFYGATTGCDVTLERRTQGVAHPGLPCGARIVVAREDRQVETRVIDRATYGSEQELALTEALAEALGVTGVDTVRWRFSSG
jgi:rare lipoprotein A (peptidoglycan hydrolase)